MNETTPKRKYGASDVIGAVAGILFSFVLVGFAFGTGQILAGKLWF